MTAGKAGGTRASSVCALQVYGGTDRLDRQTNNAVHAARRDGRTQPAAPAHDDGKAADVEVGGGGRGRGAVEIWVQLRRISVLLPPGGCAAARPPASMNTNVSRAGEDAMQSFGYCGVTYP